MGKRKKFLKKNKKDKGRESLYLKNISLLDEIERLKERVEKFRKRYQDIKNELKEALHTDQDTGLLNKKGLISAGEQIFAFSKRESMPLSIVYVDIDEFKNINDRHGHRVGDTAILHFSNILKEICRKSDLLCRDGGDEFIVLLQNSNLQDAKGLRAKIENELSRRPIIGNNGHGQLFLRASCGIVEMSSQMLTLNDLIVSGDREMYRIKRERKKGVRT